MFCLVFCAVETTGIARRYSPRERDTGVVGCRLSTVVHRAHYVMRFVSPSIFVNTHIKSRENFLLLSDEFGDKIEKRVYEVVTGNPTIEITRAQLEAKPKINREQLTNQGDKKCQSKAGKFKTGI